MLLREKIVRNCNPRLNKIDIHSPLTVGNGNFAFTADVTGIQSLYDTYTDGCPLTTMSSWGFHTCLNKDGGKYTLADLEMTEYEHNGRKVYYPVEETESNKEIYKWLRENPHRFNLARVRLMYQDMQILPGWLSDIDQTLDMYTGILVSSFKLKGEQVTVTTAVGNSDTLAVKVESLLCKNGLTVLVDFPYGSPDITGSDFAAAEKHHTQLIDKNSLNIVERRLDKETYFCQINSSGGLTKEAEHEFKIFAKDQSKIIFTMAFSPQKDRITPITYKEVIEESTVRYYVHWNMGGLIDVTASEDKRAQELERRLVTSLYLSFAQDLGDLPPQETGLTCNSWYGKFHLEMHPVHTAYAALYGRGRLLEPSLEWYIKMLPRAKENAKRNGYMGARWPKMTGPDCIDSPSIIAPLLVWQQPNIIYMLELLRLSRYRDDRVEVPKISEEEFLHKYEEVVYETALYMADCLVYDAKKDIYELLPPLYSVQEKGDPKKIKNPPFELSFFAFGLKTAAEWMKRIGKEEIAEKLSAKAYKMAKPYIHDDFLEAYEGFEDTYTKLNIDHPSMLFAYGLLSEKIDEKILLKSIDAFKKNWDFSTLWGWDFAVLSMVYAHLGRYEEAFDMLMHPASKNTYVISGNNAQAKRRDLPLYMPGNGSLLLAMTMLKSCKGWYVRTEGMMSYPF